MQNQCDTPQIEGVCLFSQLISTPINLRPVILLSKTLSPLTYASVRMYSAVSGIWNLDFFRTLYPGVCLHLTELQVLALDYLVALYPMVLMVIVYVVVELINCGCEPLLPVFRPFNYAFGRFRRRWNIQTTLIDALVTFFILSTTKFFSVSFDLLIPTVLISS